MIGGGFNGLVAAAALARAGQNVLLLEARAQPGGLCETAFVEDAVVPVAAHALTALSPEIAAMLGIKYTVRDLPLVGLRSDGRHLVLGRDIHATAQAIAPFSRADAEAYPRFRRELFALARDLRELWWSANADKQLEEVTIAHRERFEELIYSGAAAWLGGWFESDAVKAALAFDATADGAAVAAPPSALALVWRAAQEMSGLQAAVAIPDGGIGAVIGAAQRAALVAGVELRTNAAVARLPVGSGKVKGVVLATGEEIAAPLVLSKLSRARTRALAPIGAFELAEAAVPTTSDTESAKVIVALDRPVNFAKAGPRAARWIIADRIESHVQAHEAARSGRLPDELVCEVVPIPGRNLLSVLVRPVPAISCRGRGCSVRHARGEGRFRAWVLRSRVEVVCYGGASSDAHRSGRGLWKRHGTRFGCAYARAGAQADRDAGERALPVRSGHRTGRRDFRPRTRSGSAPRSCPQDIRRGARPMTVLRATPFHARAAEANRRNAWIERNGVTLSANYGDATDEAIAARFSVVLADISWRWRIAIPGATASEALARLLTRDARMLAPGRSFKTLWLNDAGAVRGTGVLARESDDDGYVLVAAAPDPDWLAAAARAFGMGVRDLSAQQGGVALIGPFADAVIRAAGLDGELDLLAFRRIAWRGVDIALSRWGEHGGYEVWCDADDGLVVWDRLARAGASFGLRLAGTQAMDILDLEAGILRPWRDYHPARNDFVATPHPRSLGLERLMDEVHPDFVGRSACLAARASVIRTLAGVALDGAVPAPHAELRRGGLVVGHTWSSCYSPSLRRAIALAELEPAPAGASADLTLLLPTSADAPVARTATARVADLPFVPIPGSVVT